MVSFPVPATATAFERLTNQPPPPTPPKETEDDIDHALRYLAIDYTLGSSPPPKKGPQPAGTPQRASRSLPSSFDEAPPRSGGSSGGDGTGRVKKVDFSPCITAHKATTHGYDPRPSPLLRRLHSSRKIKPLKSILKASLAGAQTPTPDQDSSGSPGSDYFSIDKPATFPAMLESVAKLLASPTLALRLDGYVTLNGALKAYDDLPEPNSMKAKMPLLTQFIERDVSEPLDRENPIASNLLMQALKLAGTILMLPVLESSIGDDFQSRLIDRSIYVLGQESTTKGVASHHLFILSTKNFGPRILPNQKAERLLDILLTIHDRFKSSSSSIVGHRLLIFRRLLDLNPSLMLARIRDWLPHIFHGVLSTSKEVRGRAVEAGIDAGLILGTSAPATKAIIDLFTTSTTSDDTSYGDYLAARLHDMIQQQDAAVFVPHIWSIVVLFFRSKKRTLLQWRFFRDAWLIIIQKCMNCTELEMKHRATLAWNRLIFVINPNQETVRSMDAIIPVLRIPFMSFINRKDKPPKGTRQIAISGYCHLLHYSMRPTQSFEELDTYWDVYVHFVLKHLLRAGGKNANLACRVLKALFNAEPRVWDPDLANKLCTIPPESLVRLDPRWVRSRIGKILDLLAPYISAMLASPGDDRSSGTVPWRELMTAVKEAGSQELRASVELKDALAQIMKFFQILWLDASKNFKEEQPGLWISRFGSLVQCAIEILGPLNFSDENLLRTEAEGIEPAPTPSHRSSKHSGTLQSPTVTLFTLFSQAPFSVDADNSYFSVAEDIIHQVCKAQSSRKPRLHLLRHCSSAVAAAPTPADGDNVTGMRLWELIAQQTAAAFLDTNLDDQSPEAQRLGPQVKDATQILADGLGFSVRGNKSVGPWSELYLAILSRLKQVGDGAVVVGLIEPVSETLLGSPIDASRERPLIRHVTMMLENGVWPRSRQQMDEGRRVLSNLGLAHNKNASSDTLVKFYHLINKAFVAAYHNAADDAKLLSELLTQMEHFLDICPLGQASPALRNMQSSLALPIGDAAGRLVYDDESTSVAAVKTQSLWNRILRLLKDLPSNNLLLKALDVLLVAGLNSRHRSIVNASVVFWNDTFGRLDAVEYPPSVEKALRKIVPLVDLELPTFPVPSDMCPSPLGDFLEPLDELQRSPLVVKFPLPGKAGRHSLRVSRASPRYSSAASSRSPAVPSPVPARLRHDDSQVQFVAVESSSPPRLETDEPPVMTEHQEEVASRQRYETARMFPDMISSPASSAIKARSGISPLDFTKSTAFTAADVAPTPLEDEQGPMDDYLTSSPTPKAKQTIMEIDQVEAGTNLLHERDDTSMLESTSVPSSPPSDAEDANDRGETNENEGEGMPCPSAANQFDGACESISDAYGAQATSRGTPGQDTTADLANPQEAQLDNALDPASNEQESLMDVDNREQDDALAPATGASATLNDDEQPESHQNSVEVDNKSPSSSPVHFADSLSEHPQVGVDATEVVEPGTESEKIVDKDINSNQVEDSFAGVSTPDARPTPDLLSLRSTRSSTRRSRRKRADGAAAFDPTPTKRHKPSSPLKRMYSYITGSQQEGEDSADDEFGDCIVLATPAKNAAASQTADQPERVELEAVSASAPASIDVPKKRGRGRPRKSDGEASVLSQVSSQTPLDPPKRGRGRPPKRRSSALNVSVPDDRNAEVADASASAPSRKSRRTRSNQDVKEAIEAEERQSSRAEVIEANTTNVVDQDDHMSSNEDIDAAGSQLLDEAAAAAAAAAQERPMARPKSILARIKSRLSDVLADCRTLVLGSQEEYELDHTLFEIRREIHEAGRRAREL